MTDFSVARRIARKSSSKSPMSASGVENRTKLIEIGLLRRKIPKKAVNLHSQGLCASRWMSKTPAKTVRIDDGRSEVKARSNREFHHVSRRLHMAKKKTKKKAAAPKTVTACVNKRTGATKVLLGKKAKRKGAGS